MNSATYAIYALFHLKCNIYFIFLGCMAIIQ